MSKSTCESYMKRKRRKSRKQLDFNWNNWIFSKLIACKEPSNEYQAHQWTITTGKNVKNRTPHLMRTLAQILIR